MEEELRHNPNAIFITLTLEDKRYKDIEKKYNIKGENSVATQAIRLWLERVRKITKKSIKHWCITERGGYSDRATVLRALAKAREFDRTYPIECVPA